MAGLERGPAGKCPVCSSMGALSLYELSPDEAAQHFVLHEGDRRRNQDLAANISRLWRGKGCSVRRCNDCEFIFADPYVAGDQEFYNLAYERPAYPKNKWEFQRSIGDLSSRKFHAGRILEVGAGYGYFLDKIADKFVPRSGITALEYSDEAIKILSGKGYSTEQNDFRAAEFIQKFDAIFLF